MSELDKDIDFSQLKKLNKNLLLEFKSDDEFTAKFGDSYLKIHIVSYSKKRSPKTLYGNIALCNNGEYYLLNDKDNKLTLMKTLPEAAVFEIFSDGLQSFVEKCC
jgi:hypothetical protein